MTPVQRQRRIEKAWYAAYFAALSAIFPFLPLYASRLGLSAREVGVVAALRPWVSFPSGSLWSALADKRRAHRTVFLATFTLAAVLRLSLAAAFNFGTLLAAVLATEFFAGAVTIIADAAVQASCTEEGTYGRQRLFGAVGWGVFAAVSGALISALDSISVAFALHAALSAVAAVPTALLDFRPLEAKLYAAQHQHSTSGTREEAEAPAGTRSCSEEGLCVPGDGKDSGDSMGGQPAGAAKPPAVHFWLGVRQLLSDPEALIFYTQAIFLGYGVGNIESFLFLYLDGLRASETLMGLSLTVTCVAEAVVFWYSGSIIKGLGVQRCIHLVFLAFLVRLGCYARLASWATPWLVLPVETLHGFTFALAWATFTVHSSRIAPPGLEATAQGLCQGLYFGVGFGIGGLVGGRVYQSHGGPALYSVAFGVLAAGWAATALMRLALALFNERRRYRQLPMTELVATGPGLTLNE